jgi:hypothetical protein
VKSAPITTDGQGQMSEAGVGKLCGRALRAADLETIRRVIGEADPPLRAGVARRVCAPWGGMTSWPARC